MVAPLAVTCSRTTGGPSTLQASRPSASTTPSTVTIRRTQPRVTSTTPQVASSSSATAPASGNRSAVSCNAPPGTNSARARVTAHGLLPATAARPAAARPSTTTGAKPVRLRAASATGDQAVVEAGAGARVAGRTLLVDLDQERVAVAVEPDLLDPLPVARGLPLHPVLTARPAPERRPPGGQRAVQRLVVHPAQHQHLAGVVLLHHGRDQAGGVAREPCGDGGVEPGTRVHHSSIPVPARWPSRRALPWAAQDACSRP